MTGYVRHAELQDVGRGFVATIPKTWKALRLRFVAHPKNSNVDKKSDEEQRQVLLCNYTDVYYNERLTRNLEYMPATASNAEIKSFSLQPGDVIITKDSETADDIGIPAYVSEDLPGVVCGYHLCILRPRRLLGEFLFRVIQSHATKAFFFVEVAGVTRHGLGQDTIKDVLIPMPPIEEQRAICDWVNAETARIDALIEKKIRFIELLREKAKSVIGLAAINGGRRPLKYICHSITSGPRGWSERIKNDGSSLFVQSGDLTDNMSIDYGSAARIPAPQGAEADRTSLREGDIVVCVTGAKTGRVALAPAAPGPAYVNQHLCLARPDRLKVHPAYVALVLYSRVGRDYFDLKQYGLKEGLSLEDVGDAPIPLPSLSEQAIAVEAAQRATRSMRQTIDAANRSITLLRERRAALISAAVTGQIDLRADLPTEALDRV